jgi:hypothetical protein
MQVQVDLKSTLWEDSSLNPCGVGLLPVTVAGAIAEIDTRAVEQAARRPNGSLGVEIGNSRGYTHSGHP